MFVFASRAALRPAWPQHRAQPGGQHPAGITSWEGQHGKARGEALPALPRHQVNPCLLDFGCLRDVSQLLVQAEDFGVFLFNNSDEIMQKGDVPRREEQRGQCGGTTGS